MSHQEGRTIQIRQDVNVAEKEDVNHVLFICKKYIEEREFMFRKMDKINKTVIRNIEKLIQEKDWERLKIVEQYFKEIGKQI